MDAFEFDIGDLVDKRTGYSFPGTVVGRFFTLGGEPRVVVEMDVHHVCHIFNQEQLRRRVN